MMRAATLWIRRNARAAWFFGTTGCMSIGSVDTCTPTPSGNGVLGQAQFAYACDSDGAGDTDRQTLDAWCATMADGTIPEVAVGAPIRLTVQDEDDPEPRPAVASLAPSSGTGYALAQPGWLGFLAYSGSDVVDFTHVHAQRVAAIAWQEPPPTASDVGDAPFMLSAVPHSADGTTLAGELPCTFTTSNANVLAVTNTGRIGTVTAIAVGDATITASCASQTVTTTLHVAAAAPEAGDDGGDDSEAGDDGDGGDADATIDVGVGDADASADAPDPAPTDASFLDDEGGP
jgi:hypothetical protein